MKIYYFDDKIEFWKVNSGYWILPDELILTAYKLSDIPDYFMDSLTDDSQDEIYYYFLDKMTDDTQTR